MTFSISPGVSVVEKDATNIIPKISTTAGGIVGVFQNGPLNKIVLVDNEQNLVKFFGKPNSDTFTSFFTAANFLAYGNKLRVVRVAAEATAKNATSEATTGSTPPGSGRLYVSGTGLLVKNDDHYSNSYESGAANVGPWVAKYPGAMGNSLKVSICPSAQAFDSSKTAVALTGTVSSSGTTLTGTDTAFLTQLEVGSLIRDTTGTQWRTITAIASNTSATIDEAFTSALSSDTIYQKWEYADLFIAAPGTSDYASARGSTNDEMHIVVVDEDGAYTDIPGEVLNSYAFVSKAADAKSETGASNYYATVINRNSRYIRWVDHLASGSNWGSVSTGAITYTAVNQPRSFSLLGGVDGAGVVAGDKERGWDLFSNAETVDVSVLLAANSTSEVANYIIENICQTRLDCIACVSPEMADVVDNATGEVDDTIEFRNTLTSTSYGVLDNNWKYQYDRYNDCYRWIPCNGDVAGTIVRTDKTNDPWWSPAGFTRGIIKNCVKLAYNANEAQRDDLYTASVNPIVTFPGIGTVLYGDKTLLAKPSAFDRINVRRLFIVLEKSIATAAKFMLFEFNDAFTRAQFRYMVEPFLREVKSKRGIYDFRVVCDSSNNTAEVIDSNQFVGDIYIKPARSINYIKLNFVAVRTGVEFSEIVGKI